MTQHGFRILDLPETQRCDQDRRYQWRRVNAYDFAIESHPNCPIDGTPLETIAALVSLTLPEQIRIGCCARCGLVGYIDRPSAADIDRYYAETWMGESYEQALAAAEAIEPSQKEVDLLASLPVDRSLPVLEIGCGYGRTVKALRMAGYNHIDATESCPARAKAVREYHCIDVSTEMPDKRYGLILSSHVLEHCCDPAALIRECAKRQEAGDWMVHEVPNFQGEPSMGVLLFLPHLWSFTGTTLAIMLHDSGYVCREAQITASNLRVVVKRADADIPVYVTPPKDKADKLLCGLGLVPQPSTLVWFAGRDGAAWLPQGVMQSMQDRVLQRTLTAGPVTEFRTTAPIEVQFTERVQVYVK